LGLPRLSSVTIDLREFTDGQWLVRTPEIETVRAARRGPGMRLRMHLGPRRATTARFAFSAALRRRFVDSMSVQLHYAGQSIAG